jgi:hypothetical protein
LSQSSPQVRQVSRSPNHWWASSWATSASASESSQARASWSRGRVLHPAEDEVGDEDLGVAIVGVGDAEPAGERLEHRRGARQRPLGVGLAAGRAVVDDLGAGDRAAGDLAQLAGRERHEVAGVRHVELPVQRAALALAGVADQAAVRQREEVGRDRDDQLGRRLLVRRVEAGEPAAGVLVLALAPDLEGLVGVGGLGPDEVEAAARGRGVDDRELDQLARAQPGDLDVEVAAVGAPRRRPAVAADLGDLELDRVEPQPAIAVDQRRERERRAAGDPAGGDVDVELEPVVAGGGDPIGRVLGARAGQGEVTHPATVAPRPRRGAAGAGGSADRARGRRRRSARARG